METCAVPSTPASATYEQEPENQLQELRRYVEARGWTATEYVDRGVSRREGPSARTRPPGADAKRRRFDVLVVWRLDRLGRNLKHLVTLLEDVQAVGIAFVSLAEGATLRTLLPCCQLAPHDLRRTCARLCHLAGGELDQISISAGPRLNPDDGALPWMQTATTMRGQRPSRNRAGRRVS